MTTSLNSSGFVITDEKDASRYTLMRDGNLVSALDYRDDGSFPVIDAMYGGAFISNAPVTYAEAALGADIEVPTLGGQRVKLRIPAGTPNGRTFRVRGRGVSRKNGEKADLLVTVEVQVPASMNQAASDALKAHAEALGATDPRAGLFTK